MKARGKLFADRGRAVFRLWRIRHKRFFPFRFRRPLVTGRRGLPGVGGFGPHKRVRRGKERMSAGGKDCSDPIWLTLLCFLHVRV